MKRNFLTKAITRTSAALFAAALCVSCNVDDSYDLSNLNSDEIGVGTDDTEFNLPVATVSVDLASILGITETTPAGAMVTRTENSDSEFDYSKVIDLIGVVETLMPTGEEIDLTKLNDDSTENEDYVAEVVSKLFDELKNSYDKCYSLCETATNGDYDDVLDEVNGLLDNGYEISTTSSEEDLAAAATELQNAIKNADDDELDAIKAQIVAEIIKADLELEDVAIEKPIDDFDIDQDTIDLITKNLDGIKNKIYLRVSYVYNLPIKITITTTIKYDGNSLDLCELGSKDDTTENGVIEEDALNSILSGFTLDTKVSFGTYTSTGTSLMETLRNEKLEVNLIVKKTGSLKF